MSYIAAIDIGSNALRLAIASTVKNELHITYRSREAVRLGSSVFSSGSIDKKTYEDLKNALLQFKDQLENHKVQKKRAVATSAMREATNGKEVVDQLFNETGIQVEIISGDEEARLISLAISNVLDLSKGDFLCIDIGGGSIELVAIVKGKILKKQSFVAGMVRILELQKTQNAPIENWFPAFIRNELGDFFDDLPPIDNAVGTGGNMDRFIKLKSFVSDEEGSSLNKKEMKKLYNCLNSSDYNERILKFALKPDRADVIIPAAIATNEIMRLTRADKIFFPEVGLKDGLLYELSSEIKT